MSGGTATIGISRRNRLARKGLCFETHLNSGPIWSFKAVVASTPTTVISFGEKSKLMTVLALHISACWLFHFFKAVITYFLPLGQLSSPLATGFRLVVANVTHVFAPLRPSLLEISLLDQVYYETYGHPHYKIKVSHVECDDDEPALLEEEMTLINNGSQLSSTWYSAQTHCL